jgi:hypothetical protein
MLLVCSSRSPEVPVFHSHFTLFFDSDVGCMWEGVCLVRGGVRVSWPKRNYDLNKCFIRIVASCAESVSNLQNIIN